MPKMPKKIIIQGTYYDPDRERVRELRLKGAVTEQIAAETGLSEEKVRAYLTELGLPETGCCLSDIIGREFLNTVVCPQCGAVIEQSGIGRAKKFCSRQCHDNYWNNKKCEKEREKHG